MYLTSRELLFKCSGTPFVIVRIELNEITNVVKIKNYKHKMSSVLSIETRKGGEGGGQGAQGTKSFVFYKFRLPRNLMRSILLKLVHETKSRRVGLNIDSSTGGATGYVEASDDLLTDTEHIMRLKRISQPLHSFASMIRTSLNGMLK